MSADGQQIYFTSDRPGGLGGMDIWVTNLLPDGSWGEAKNLGPAINTEFDEEGPFIHPDNITLYFSSKGHNSIGGYDIFSAEKNEFGTWRLAKNLGYPVNTIYDNLFFQMSANGKRAYYASQSESSGGNTNLFMCVFPNAEEKPLTIMIGHVTVPCGELPFVSITVNDLVSNKIVGIFAPNSKTGKFIFFLNRGKDYQISVEANDQEVLLDTIHVNADAKFEEIYKNIVLEPIEPCSKTVVEVREDVKEHKIIAKKLKFPGDDIEYDEAIEIKNILFPVGENEFRGPNRSTDALAEYLKHNPTAVVEIGGHTDSSGKKPNNDRLSLKRAKSVKNYLLRKGVNSRQLTPVGYGSSVPIAKDHNDDQSWNEQSMSYNRRIEFKVLTQGKSLLKILQIDNIPADLKVKQIVVVISKDGE
jgi:outer membrane protein OmpA-like peptidoglycan-associated protein